MPKGEITFKENIKKYYNQEAELRNSISTREDWKVKVRENYYDLIKKENKQALLELGAGPGYDSQYFMNNGLEVTAVDLSSEMVSKCREKGIEAYELDYYNLSSEQDMGKTWGRFGTSEKVRTKLKNSNKY